MVISGITDGLGNQMFQYACGRSLALHKQTTFKIDTAWFSNIEQRFTQRDFRLDKLNTEISIASAEEIKKLKQPKYPFIINSIYWRRQYALPYYKRHFFKEQQFNYDENLLHAGKDVYLQGFFQSYKYFEKIRELLLREFTPKQLPPVVAEKEKSIKSGNAVSLHIRRGDYVAIGNAQYVLDLSYYHRALEVIQQSSGGVKVFIFSDEPEWAKQNLALDVETEVVSSPDILPEHDIYLMSCCKHNIIANSSFSWWGAWLNNNPGKIVTAPKEWFKGNTKDTRDLIPQNWIQL